MANRGGGDTGNAMWKSLIDVSVLLTVSGSALAASAVNNDSDPRTLIVTEGSSKRELTLGPGETVEFCPSGWLVTTPYCDPEELTGADTIDFSGGMARVK